MSDNAPKLDPKTLAKRRVLGVPVLYLLAGGVLLLALYAWKARKSPDAEPVTDTGDEVVDSGYMPSSELFPVQQPGTVVVAPATTPPLANSAIETNSVWLSKGVAFLGTQGVSGGAAQNALQTYLDGGSLSTVQGTYRDKVIAEFGIPPQGARTTGDADVKPLLQGYFQKSGEPAIYAAYADGTLDWLDRAEWEAAGKPTPNIIGKDDGIWRRPVVGGDHP